jgi:sirohydrochlorin ferrochelatase
MHPSSPGAARLLIAAHGTRSPAGSATTAALAAAVAAARPDLHVDLCYLDVASPSLAEALDGGAVPTVVVPALLSTGYHVQQDIPAAAAGRGDVRVARHLGPHPLLTEALLDRLVAARGSVAPESTLLVGAGSSRPDAAAELDAAARLLAEQLGRPVAVATVDADLRAELDRLDEPREVATYLLAEGRFTETITAAAAGRATVAAPLGAHPAVVRLVLARYDEAIARA